LVNTSQKPRIAITMGDPAGVGPELCLRLLADSEITDLCTPIIFGSAGLLRRVGITCELEFDYPTATIESLNSSSELEGPLIVDVKGLESDAVVPGVVNADTGQGSFDFIEAAIKAAQEGTIDAVVTGPINKEAWDAAGIAFPGHTELFADRCDTQRFCMMMYSPAFSCSLVTTHIGYLDVPGEMTTQRITEVIELSHAAIKKIERREATLTVLGLNPHAGEKGLFGNREEERLIEPAIEAAQKKGFKISGPLPPDTGFLTKHRQQTDVYICMYHDQGLIPFKAFNFDTGVNVTLGLPMVRTSVDHGTALDIAWKGTADPASLRAAVRLAAKLA